MAFIDGMHLAEFALRDFIGVERLSPWTGVIVFDDILPRTVEEAARDRRTRAWTGDVYKVLGILARHRPDLICLRVGTQPTGLLLVLGLDPANRALSLRQDLLLEQMVVPDPQDVPADVLERRGVLEPEAVLASRAWPVLRDLRDQGEHAARGHPRPAARRARRPRPGQPRRAATALARLSVADHGPRQPAVGAGAAAPGAGGGRVADDDPAGRVGRDDERLAAPQHGHGAREAGHRRARSGPPSARAGAGRRRRRRSARSARLSCSCGRTRPVSRDLQAHRRSGRAAGTRSRRRGCAGTRRRRRGAARPSPRGPPRGPPAASCSVGGTQNVRSPWRSKRSARRPACRARTRAAARGACRRARSRGRARPAQPPLVARQAAERVEVAARAAASSAAAG